MDMILDSSHQLLNSFIFNMVDKNQMKRNIFPTDAILEKVEWVIIKVHYFVINVQIESTLEICHAKRSLSGTGSKVLI